MEKKGVPMETVVQKRREIIASYRVILGRSSVVDAELSIDGLVNLQASGSNQQCPNTFL